jgi:hypothetical protein
VIDCHTLVARAALAYWADEPAVYIDLEDNCFPTQRADYDLVAPAARKLLARPEWMFIHLSRFPAPVGIFDPHTSSETPLYEWGGNVYQKLFGTCELAQAMLCHTRHAARIVDDNFRFELNYDDQFASEMTHVVYPAIFQRRTASETATVATAIFSTLFGIALRDFAFTPWCAPLSPARSIWAHVLQWHAHTPAAPTLTTLRAR